MSNMNAVLSPKWFFQVVDALGILVAFGLAWMALPAWGPWLNPDFRPVEENSAGLLLLTLPLWLLLLDWGGMYIDPVHISYGQIVLGMVRILVLSVGSVTLVVFGVKGEGVSRLFVFSFETVSFAVLTALRFAEKGYYGARDRAGYYARQPLVIATAHSLQLLREFIRTSHSETIIKINAWPVVEGETDPTTEELASFADNIRERLARQTITEVVIILGRGTEMLLDTTRSICEELGQPVRVISESILQLKSRTSLTAQADPFLGVPSLLLLRAEQRPVYEFLKRLLDMVVSALLLVLLSPLFVIIGLAVKLTSPGPVFYRWRVLGQNNREFTGFKFRTMVHNADQLKADLLKYNEMSGPVFKMKHDPRVTPIGRFLRRYSLDELPQLFSVLKGDMSLVGPRPPLKSEFERFEFWHTRKLSVKPGITCLWQAGGRNEIKDFDDWVRLDLEYIDRRSMGMDLQIMAQTVLAVLKGTGH